MDGAALDLAQGGSLSCPQPVVWDVRLFNQFIQLVEGLYRGEDKAAAQPLRALLQALPLQPAPPAALRTTSQLLSERILINLAEPPGLDALAITGRSSLRHAPLLFTPIELLGAGYLLWIVSRLIRSQPGTLTLEGAVIGAPSLTKQFMLGISSALLNPKNALFYLALKTTLSGASVTLLSQSAAGIWMVAVVLIWDLLLVRIIGMQKVQRRLAGNVWLIECGAGAVLIAFALWILTRFLTG